MNISAHEGYDYYFTFIDGYPRFGYVDLIHCNDLISSGIENYDFETLFLKTKSINTK